jgi:membrane protein
MEYVDEITSLPRRWLMRLWNAYLGFNEHDGLSLAAAAAYYFALSLFPLLLVLVAALGFALESTAAAQDARERLLALIEQQASPELSQQIGRALQQVSEQAPASGPFGFVALIVTAIAIFTQVDHSFNRIWHVADDPDQGWVQWAWRLVFRRLRALLMLLAAGAFVFVGTIASLVWAAVQVRIAPALDLVPEARWGFGMAINIGLNFLAFTLIYKFVPAANVRWGEALRGACVAALLWEAGRQVLEVYLVRQGYPSAYGVIGSFMAIILWAYYAMVVVFYGAEYTRVVREEFAARGETTV